MSRILLAATLALTACGEADPPPAAQPPEAPAATAKNLVFIVLDTTRADAMGYAGYTRPTSPSLDAFAAQSLVFDRAYSHAPWTVPSVASMFTSLTPLGHGIKEWDQILDDRHETLAEALQDAGFATRAVVSHHAFKPRYQFQQGFDDYDWSLIAEEKAYDYAHSKAVTDKGLAAIDAAAADGGRWFVWLHYFDAHTKYLPHPEFPFGDSKRDLYDGELAYQDAALGTLFEGLEARGALEDTVVVVVADHGEEFKDHGGTKHTSTLYDELVRVPLVIRAPGLAPGREGTVVAASDLAPTVLSLLDVPAPDSWAGAAMPKVEAEGGWTLDPADGRPVYLETFRRKQRQGVVVDGHKVIHDLKKDRWQLFDLTADPFEKRNLAKKQPERLAAMQQTLEGIRSAERAPASSVPLGAEMMERLQALGYVE